MVDVADEPPGGSHGARVPRVCRSILSGKPTGRADGRGRSFYNAYRFLAGSFTALHANAAGLVSASPVMLALSRLGTIDAYR
ncbi:hypothetical protein [Paraburkholderia sp.]|uniref:hypothetical protein n=1 Tax=Paraburkholderia sp. TaxID=1926495 RepID=UPI0039E64651